VSYLHSVNDLKRFAPLPNYERESWAALDRLAVLLCARFPLSLLNVEDLLHEHRFAPMFAAERRRNLGWLDAALFELAMALRLRERAMLRFRQMRCLQKFAAVHSSVHNHFNQERHFYSRDNFKLNRTAALTEWRQLLSA